MNDLSEWHVMKFCNYCIQAQEMLRFRHHVDDNTRWLLPGQLEDPLYPLMSRQLRPRASWHVKTRTVSVSTPLGLASKMSSMLFSTNSKTRYNFPFLRKASFSCTIFSCRIIRRIFTSRAKPPKQAANRCFTKISSGNQWKMLPKALFAASTTLPSSLPQSGFSHNFVFFRLFEPCGQPHDTHDTDW